MEKRNTLVITAIIVVLALIGAGAAWYYSGRTSGTSALSPEDARYRRAEQACLSNTANKRDGNVTAKAGTEEQAVSVGAGVSTSDVQKRGPGEAVAQDEYLNEANAIRDCMARYLLQEERAK
jgi:hypothetical protein